LLSKATPDSLKAEIRAKRLQSQAAVWYALKGPGRKAFGARGEAQGKEVWSAKYGVGSLNWNLSFLNVGHFKLVTSNWEKRVSSNPYPDMGEHR
jgi:hypothetical protein